MALLAYAPGTSAIFYFVLESPFVVAFVSPVEDVVFKWCAAAAALLALFLYSLRLIFFLIGLGVATAPFMAAVAKGLGRFIVNGDCTTEPLADTGVVADVAGVGVVKTGTGGR